MKSLVVKTARCPQNHAYPSVRVCPVGALSQKMLMLLISRYEYDY